MMVFEEYDQKQIKEARRLLWNVYEANCGDPSLKKAQDRLCTIIGKIDQLLNLKGETHVRQESRNPRR